MTPEPALQEGTLDRAQPEERILEVLSDGRRLTVDEILERVPEISWAQLFIAMDILSRRGAVELRREGFTYSMRMVTSSIYQT
jgi:DNA-binding transcriptional ArsR family regulator